MIKRIQAGSTVDECIVNGSFLGANGGSLSIDGCLVWDWYGSPRFAVIDSSGSLAIEEKLPDNYRCRLFSVCDVGLDVDRLHVDLPQTWQQVFEQTRARTLIGNYADLIAETIPSDGRFEFILDMYCLQDFYYDRRTTSVRGLDSDVILRAIRDKWPEFRDGFHMVVNFVFPQPSWLDVTTIVLIVEFFQPGHDFDHSIPILLADQDREVQVGEDFKWPIYVQPVVQGRDVLKQANLEYECQPLGHRRCLFKTSQVVFAQDETWNSYRGAYVVIYKEDVMNVKPEERNLIKGLQSWTSYLDAQQMRLQGGPTIELRTHAVNEDGDPLGMRRMHIDMEEVMNPRQVGLWIYDLWVDRASVADPTVYVIDPQPTQPLQTDRVISHLLVRFGSSLSVEPVLCTLTASFGDDPTIQQIGLQAQLFPLLIDEYEVFQRLGMLQFARDFTTSIYVRQGYGEILDPSRQYSVVPAANYFVHLAFRGVGEFLQLLIGGRFGTAEDLPVLGRSEQDVSDTDEDAGIEEEEAFVGMQRPGALTSSRSVPVRLMGLHGVSAVIQIDPSLAASEQIAQLWPFTDRSHDEVSELIQLHNPPAAPGFSEDTHVDTYLLQYSDDLFEQVHPDDILTLVSIVFVGPRGWTHHKRRVVWSPQRLSRDQFLIFLRVYWHCQRPSVICFAYVNGIHWAFEDVRVRTLEPGTHLFLRMRSDNEDWCDVEHSERLERQRRVFISSESEGEVGEAIQDPGEGDIDEVDEPVEGSRSRSRSFSSRHDSEESSLVQTHVVRLRPGEGSSSAFVLRKGMPHVSDLWCAEPWADKSSSGSLEAANDYDWVSAAVRRPLVSRPWIWVVYAFLQNEFVIVFYLAVAAIMAMIHADVCKCRRTRLCVVGRVRHQVCLRERSSRSAVSIFLVYLVVSQHGFVPAHGLQFPTSDQGSMQYGDYAFSTFSRLPPPGNGMPSVLVLDDLLQEDSGCRGPTTAEVVPDADTHCGVDVPDAVVDTLASLLHGPLRSMSTSEIDVDNLHESTKQVWQSWGPDDTVQRGIKAVHIYTDGSAGLHYANYEYERKAAWAFGVWLETDNGFSLLATDSGHVCLDPQDGQWTGAGWGSSAEGERAALLSSAVFALRMHPPSPIFFWFDSTTAGFGASGRWSHNKQHKDAVLLRCTFQVLEARCQQGVYYRHVKAHQGDPYNELVNTLAYGALTRQKQNSVLDFNVGDLLIGERPLCAHWVTIYLASSGGSQYPSFEHGSLVWHRKQALPNRDLVWRDFTQELVSRPSEDIEQFTVVSFNVRTMYARSDDLALHTSVGAYAMLEEQLLDRKVDIAFLQETRSRSSHVINSYGYKRFAVAAEQGNGGTEIWIAQRPAAANGSRFLNGKNHVVLHQSNECLLLRLEAPSGPLLLVSAHAPHSSHEVQFVRSWWEDLTQKVRKFAGSGRIIVGIDANAHFAQCHSDIVGPVGSEQKENVSAQYFLHFLEHCSCWLPSTFIQYHYGVTESWRHPGRGTWHRNDYVAISCTFAHAGIQSWVDGNFDVGGSSVDHLVVALRIFCRGSQSSVGQVKSLGVNIDVKALVKAEDEVVAGLFQEVTPIDWDSNIHDHGAVFVRQVRHALETKFPKQGRGPKKSFISDDAWQIRGARRIVRRQMYHRRCQVQWSDLGAAWYAWKTDVPLSQVAVLGRSWTLLCILADMKDRLLLRRYGFQLRQCLRQDKERYCQQVAQEAATLPASFVVRKLRCLGFRSKRTPETICPLADMSDETGSTCQTVDDVNRLWQRFFEEMEDGEEISTTELLNRCEAKHRTDNPPVPKLEEMMTLLDLETALRQNKYNKASYFDGVPSDLGRRFPHLLAKAFIHLAWKQQLLVQEPVTYKGGISVQAFKGRGSPSLAENYRALMVSSILAKAAHRSLRGSTMGSFDAYRIPLQIGGLEGRSVAQGAHCLISYASMCRKAGRSYAILFVDIKQAFYRLFREHIVKSPLDDVAVQRLFATLCLPPEAFADFVKELEERSALESSGASPFVCAHVQEALHGTWFKLLGSTRISQTKRGSRPGDNLADILFAFAFRRILRKVLDQLHDEGCSMHVESLGVAHPYPDQLGVYPLVRFDTLGPIWADDLAVLISDETASSLMTKLRYVGQVLFDHLERAGMQVNFSAGKTEAVLDIRGPGALEIRKELFRHRPPVLDIPGPQGSQRFCRLVATYKHLGTVFSQRGRMLPEIRNRLGQARQAFRKNRKLIFGNDRLPIKTRTQLFLSLVMSVLQFNIAIWPPLSRNEHQAFAKGVQALYNSLAFAYWGATIFNWRVERVADSLGLSQVDIVLRNARLRYFQHLTLKADEFVWACIHLDDGWLGLLRADLAWMYQQIPFSMPTSPPDTDWPTWEALVRHRTRWKSLVSRACAHADGQRALRSHWHDGHRRALDVLREVGFWSDSTKKPDLGVHACMRCQKRFKTKSAWAVHAFRAHNRVTSSRRVAHGLQCLICNKVYALHSRLVNHLRYSTACADAMRQRGLTTQVQPSIGSKVEQRNRLRILAPVLQAEGPSLPRQGQRQGGWDPGSI